MAFRLQPVRCVTQTVHRLIEKHASARGDAIALIDGDASCSYRELNAAANVVARRLMAAGFRRGMCAQVHISPSIHLAVVLLAVLKVGGSYTWTDPGPFANPEIFVEEPGGAQRAIDIGDVPVRGMCGPNLPVITRETDIACLIRDGIGEACVAVPHATIVAMAACADGNRSAWAGESGAFDLWAALMTGATAFVKERPAAVAA